MKKTPALLLGLCLAAMPVAASAETLTVSGIYPAQSDEAALVGSVAVELIGGADGAVLQVRSRYAAQRALRDAGATAATFIHRSAYGELIGMATVDQDTVLREIMVLADQ